MTERKPITIQIDSDFDMEKPINASFYKLCVGWGKELQKILSAGVSCRFSVSHYGVTAEFRWNGKEFSKITQVDHGDIKYLTDDPNPGLGNPLRIENVWDQAFGSRLSLIVNLELLKLQKIQSHISAEDRKRHNTHWKVDPKKFKVRYF